MEMSRLPKRNTSDDVRVVEFDAGTRFRKFMELVLRLYPSLESMKNLGNQGLGVLDGVQCAEFP